MPSFSRNLEETLHRSVAYANQRKHEYATLEHLLLSVADDPDAVECFDACMVPTDRVKKAALNYIDNDLGSLVSDSGEDAKPTAGFQRVIQRAVIHAQSNGRNVVDGSDVLISIFSERESHAAYFLQEMDITRYDVINFKSHGIRKKLKPRNPITRTDRQLAKLDSAIADSGQSAPKFAVTRKGIALREAPATDTFHESKSETTKRYKEVLDACSRRLGNSHPELARLASEYGQRLRLLRVNRGAFRLMTAAQDLEHHLRLLDRRGKDDDENPPLSLDDQSRFAALMNANALLLISFPDMEAMLEKARKFRELSRPKLIVTDKLLDPVIEELAKSVGLLEEGTRQITNEIAAKQPNERDPESASVIAKHSWLRGVLTTAGKYLHDTIRSLPKIGRDAALKEGFGFFFRHSDKMAAAIVTYFAASKPALLALAEGLSTAFGWIASLFKILF